jgi:hypothetical protein
MSAVDDHSQLGEQVIRTLLYFDIFNYPLKAGEIFNFLRVERKDPTDVSECLEALTEQQHVFRFGDLYSLHANEHDVKRRLQGNREAERCLSMAMKRARFIGRFPFVRGVMASGSLSKGYMDENSDFDFFIVTAPGRLWIARTMLVLFKRIFLKNSHKRFCVNYFVDEAHLEIDEKNLFTATELATLIPLHNHSAYEALISSNRWVTEYFPNFRPRRRYDTNASTVSVVGQVFEFLLSPFSFWIDPFLMKISSRRWRRLYATRYEKQDFEIAFKTKRHVSKNHPNYYQKRVLDLYQRKLREYQHRLAEVHTARL